MGEQSDSPVDVARAFNGILQRIEAVIDRLDSASALTVSDISLFHIVLQPVFDLSDSLASRKSVELEEAAVYLSKSQLCGLLLSLLGRWPWAEIGQERAVAHKGLALLPRLLCALCAFLRVEAHVPSSQQAEAYADTRKREVCARGKTLYAYQVMNETAAGLVEYAQKAAPDFEVVSAFGSSLTSIQQAGHPGLMILQDVALQWFVFHLVSQT